MVLGGKEVYWADDYVEKTGSFMQLWTIIDGDIYLERGPHYFDHKGNQLFIFHMADELALFKQFNKLPYKI
jgi:hypothetical protein